MYIEKVNSPADVKKLSVSEMNGLGGPALRVRFTNGQDSL